MTPVVATVLQYCDINSSYFESLLQGQTVHSGELLEHHKATNYQSYYYSKYIPVIKVIRLAACVEQMISDVVQHLDRPLQVFVTMTSF